LLIDAQLIVNISERLIIIYVQILSSGKKTHRPVPRRVNKSKNNITETDFFSHTEYAIPWNQLRSMWILYFGVQDEFPEGVGLKEIQKLSGLANVLKTILESTKESDFLLILRFENRYMYLIFCANFLHGQTTVIINKCVKFMSIEFLVVE